jgi:hypothetical protein
MSKLSANYLVIRDNQNYRIKGKHLYNNAFRTDKFFVQRDDEHFYVNVNVGAGIIASVGTTDDTKVLLTMKEGTDMSQYLPNGEVKQVRYDLIDYESPQQQPLRVVEGVIASVNENTREITLTDGPKTGPFAINFEVGGNLEAVIDDSEFPEILDDDLFVCTDVNDVTYKVTGEKFKEVIKSPEERRYKCWEEAVSEYLQCRLLCESDYCLSICLTEFTNQVTRCALIEDEI